MTKLKFHYDAGHGWLEVPKSLFKEIMGEELPSEYSYQDKNNFYLEEDCDAPKFLAKYKGNNPEGWSKSFEEVNDGDTSFIRNLENVE